MAGERVAVKRVKHEPVAAPWASETGSPGTSGKEWDGRDEEWGDLGSHAPEVEQPGEGRNRQERHYP
jgi:hypothetical protein